MEIRTEELVHVYNLGTPLEVRALDEVTFTLPNAAALGIFGGAGSGKTTLVKHFNGLLMPTSGRVLLDGRDPHSLGAAVNRKVGLVFQRPERQLFGETVIADIAFVLRRFSGLSEGDILARVERVCRLIGLDLQALGDRPPLALADGEKRKVAIAGVLVNEPEVLILDEPAVGMDPPSIGDLVRVLAKTKHDGDRGLIIVSHEMEPFLPILDYLMALDRGRLVAFGRVNEVYAELREHPVMADYLPDSMTLDSRTGTWSGNGCREGNA